MIRGAGIEALGLMGEWGLSVTRSIPANALISAALMGVWWARVLAERMLAGLLVSVCTLHDFPSHRRWRSCSPEQQ